MKKKLLFGILLVSALNMSVASNITQLSECEVLGINAHNDLQAAGYSHADAYEISGHIIEICEWSTSFK